MVETTGKKTQIFAHRGFSGKYPENSPLAFRKTAEETGAGGIESDVHLSKDGQLVIIHDNTVNRTSNGAGYVKDLTYEELLSLDIGSCLRGGTHLDPSPAAGLLPGIRPAFESGTEK